MSAMAFAAQARIWSARAGAAPPQQELAAELAQQVASLLEQGHSCVPLAGPTRDQVLATAIVGLAEAPGSHPLVLDREGRLYLHRLFDAERRLADALVGLALPEDDALPGGATPAAAGPGAAPGGLASTAAADPQRLAVELARHRRLLVISGGPGTGKTTTVVRILQALLDDAPGQRIVLAAPTGKAAARMQEALRERLTGLPADQRARLPAQAGTVHRLLGQDARGRVRHHAGNPLPLDVLVVDEASMLDLALAARLCAALPAGARLILLGDRDQLAAVESGAVFAELAGLPAGHPLRTSVVQFERQYRFPATSPLGQFAAAVRSGDAGAALSALAHGESELDWREPAAASQAPGPDAFAALEQGYQHYWSCLEGPSDPAAAFAAFGGFRVLCALRGGPWGSEALSAWLERVARARLDAPQAGAFASPWYRGRPVMVLRNDPLLQLWNGDIGIALPDEDGELAVFFPAEEGTFRRIAPVRLPPHETAFASSVHKAQGSEFGRIALVLPSESGPVLSRELVYTGVTRARHGVLLLARRERLTEALANPTRRHSGLLSRLDDCLADRGRDRA